MDSTTVLFLLFFFFLEILNLGFSQNAFQKKFFHYISSVHCRKMAVRVTTYLMMTAVPCDQPLLITKSPPCFRLKIVSSKGWRSTALAGNSLAHRNQKAHTILCCCRASTNTQCLTGEVKQAVILKDGNNLRNT